MELSGKVQRIAAKRYWRASDARVLLKAQRSSGMSIAAFSQHLGFKARRLEHWNSKLKIKEEQSLAFPGFMQIEVKPVTELIKRTELEVVVGDVVVRVKQNFDDETLRRVISILGERC